jgi:glycosyltransferase involved in cell wall biosynthesis
VLLSEYESLGLAALEALASSRPLLVTDATALHELVADGLARGVPLGASSEEVARAIQEELDDPRPPQAARLPTWSACASALRGVYEDTVRRRT